MWVCGRSGFVHRKKRENALLEAVKEEKQLPAVRDQLIQDKAN